jgi:hypothetical protein
LAGALGIFAGESYACALLSGSTAKCWVCRPALCA